MDTPPLIILGSARKNGDTHQLVTSMFAGKEAKQLDLLDFQVAPYSYSGEYPPSDQFPAIIQQLLPYKSIVFATPVYWYAMSGYMKLFFDRLTDLVTINKPLGRQMKGKKIYLLAVGAEDVLPPGFDVPFDMTSAYFDMQFMGFYYCKTADLQTMPDTESFLSKVYSP